MTEIREELTKLFNQIWMESHGSKGFVIKKIAGGTDDKLKITSYEGYIDEDGERCMDVYIEERSRTMLADWVNKAR